MLQQKTAEYPNEDQIKAEARFAPERAARLDQREKQLDTLAGEIVERETTVKKIEQDLKAAAAELEARSKELDKREAALSHKK